MQQAGSGSRRTCGAPVGSDAGPGFRAPASDRPRMWSGETRSCEHHALRLSSKEVVEAGFKWNGVGHVHGAQFPALGGLYAKVARQGPWFVPFWRGPRLSSSPNSLGVGICSGSVLVVSMTLRHRSSRCRDVMGSVGLGPRCHPREGVWGALWQCVVAAGSG